MSVTGKVVNGSVVLPPGTKLPEGAEVRIETLKLTSEDDPLVAAVEKLAKPRPPLPKVYPLNHGHYFGGEPKKCGARSPTPFTSWRCLTLAKNATCKPPRPPATRNSASSPPTGCWRNLATLIATQRIGLTLWPSTAHWSTTPGSKSLPPTPASFSGE